MDLQIGLEEVNFSFCYSYFLINSLNKTIFNTDKNGNRKQTIVTDVFRRILLDKFFKNKAALTGYYVSDGDTPELIAYKEYGDVNLHWIILLANDIVDLNKEWPLSTEDLILYITDKYGANNISDVHHYVITDNKSIIVDWDATKVSNGTYTAVTNLEYETELNDAKRQIAILDQVYLKDMRNQFNKLIRKSE